MAVGSYRFTLKSEEQRGASQANILEINLASEADAQVFKTNLETLFAADVVTVDTVLSENYSLPYPVGNGSTMRLACFTSEFQQFQMRLREWDTTKNIATFTAALIAAGLRAPFGDFPVVTAINGYFFQPGQYTG